MTDTIKLQSRFTQSGKGKNKPCEVYQIQIPKNIVKKAGWKKGMKIRVTMTSHPTRIILKKGRR